jgi:hypothetical protein
MVLEGVFGARLPQTLRIARWPVMTSMPDWFELRAYQCSDPARLEALHDLVRSRLQPLVFEWATNLTYLIPFRSLAERNGAWTLFDADPEWHRLRSQGEPVSVCEVTIYRPAGGQTIGSCGLLGGLRPAKFHEKWSPKVGRVANLCAQYDLHSRGESPPWTVMTGTIRLGKGVRREAESEES